MSEQPEPTISFRTISGQMDISRETLDGSGLFVPMFDWRRILAPTPEEAAEDAARAEVNERLRAEQHELNRVEWREVVAACEGVPALAAIARWHEPDEDGHCQWCDHGDYVPDDWPCDHIRVIRGEVLDA